MKVGDLVKLKKRPWSWGVVCSVNWRSVCVCWTDHSLKHMYVIEMAKHEFEVKNNGGVQ